MENNLLMVTTVPIGLILGTLWGDWDGFLITLVTLSIFDLITGLANGFISKTLNSQRIFKGIFKKIAIMLIVAMAHVIDTYITHTPGVYRTMIILYYVANEGLSVIENCGKLGLPVPKKIGAALEQLTEDSTEETDIDTEEEEIPHRRLISKYEHLIALSEQVSTCRSKGLTVDAETWNDVCCTMIYILERYPGFISSVKLLEAFWDSNMPEDVFELYKIMVRNIYEYRGLWPQYAPFIEHMRRIIDEGEEGSIC